MIAADWKPHPDYRSGRDRTPSIDAPRPAALQPLPRDQWPLVALAIAKLTKPTDRGIGDTVQRMTAKAGGEAFKRVYKRIMGEDCGCGDRQARMNLLYPYEAPAAPPA